MEQDQPLEGDLAEKQETDAVPEVPTDGEVASLGGVEGEQHEDKPELETAESRPGTYW